MKATLLFVEGVFGRRFALAMAALAVFAFVLPFRRWDPSLAKPGACWRRRRWSGSSPAAASKTVHDFARRLCHGARRGQADHFGIAFLVMWPVLFTESLEAWKLTRRRSRVAIGAAGAIAELDLAIAALLLCSAIDPGLFRNALFMISAFALRRPSRSRSTCSCGSTATTCRRTCSAYRTSTHWRPARALAHPAQRVPHPASATRTASPGPRHSWSGPGSASGSTGRPCSSPSPGWSTTSSSRWSASPCSAGDLDAAGPPGLGRGEALKGMRRYMRPTWSRRRGRIAGRRGVLFLYPFRVLFIAPAIVVSQASVSLDVETPARRANPWSLGRAGQAGDAPFVFASPDSTTRSMPPSTRSWSCGSAARAGGFGHDGRRRRCPAPADERAAAEPAPVWPGEAQLTIRAPRDGELVDVAPDLRAGRWYLVGAGSRS